MVNVWYEHHIFSIQTPAGNSFAVWGSEYSSLIGQKYIIFRRRKSSLSHHPDKFSMMILKSLRKFGRCVRRNFGVFMTDRFGVVPFMVILSRQAQTENPNSAKFPPSITMNRIPVHLHGF
jgi:hypothetical protein